jgi:hypothetical protein
MRFSNPYTRATLGCADESAMNGPDPCEGGRIQRCRMDWMHLGLRFGWISSWWMYGMAIDQIFRTRAITCGYWCATRGAANGLVTGVTSCQFIRLSAFSNSLFLSVYISEAPISRPCSFAAMSDSISTPVSADFSSSPPKRTKIVLLGDQSVGKTSLITRSVSLLQTAHT